MAARSSQDIKRCFPTVTCYYCRATGFAEVRMVQSLTTSGIATTPQVTYITPDALELGNLILPCSCKANWIHQECVETQRAMYLHEGDEEKASRCSICLTPFHYNRLIWAKIVSHRLTQLSLSVLLALLLVFLFGFIADPIINLYLDPYETIAESKYFEPNIDGLAQRLDASPSSWVQHFAKGLSSLGVLSCLNVLFTMSPWQWLNLRTSNLLAPSGRGRPGNTGRDRVASISAMVLILGIVSFFYYVWKTIKACSGWFLVRFKDSILHVQDFMTFEDYVDVMYDPAAQAEYNEREGWIRSAEDQQEGLHG